MCLLEAKFGDDPLQRKEEMRLKNSDIKCYKIYIFEENLHVNPCRKSWLYHGELFNYTRHRESPNSINCSTLQINRIRSSAIGQQYIRNWKKSNLSVIVQQAYICWIFFKF